MATIPRSSSVSVGIGTIGNALTININRQSSSFKHTVRYAWGNKQGTIASNVDTSTTWTIPLDFANNIPNATSGTGTIFVDTYSGSTKTGTQQVAFTANVPTSMKPTFSGVTLTDTNGVARGLLSGNNFLQIISNIQVNFNGASGSYSSSITGYKAEVVNRNLVTNSNGGTLGMMNFNGSATIRASVVDSRGRWSDTRDVTINVIEYFAPILSFTAQRTRQTPNIIQIVRNAKIAPITLSGIQKNIMTLTFKVAPLGSTSYTADNGSASGSWTTQHTLSNSAANMAGNYPANKSFTIIGTLSDKFTSVEFSATVATESVVMSYNKDGRVGVGKIAENGPAGSLDVAGNIYAGGKQIQQYQLTNVEGNTIYAYNTDVNTHVNNGTRWINPGCANSPFPSNYGWIETYRATTDIFQIARSWSGGWKVYRRHAGNYKSSNGSATWYPWVEITPQTNHPMLQEKPLKTLTMGFPYSMKANLVRKGDVVTISLIRNIYSVDSFEHAVMQEKIPAGYRPVVDVHMTVNTNVSQFTKSPNILHFAPDGTIRMTSNTVGGHVMTGTITYITNDPYPA
ncbi:phage structural protein [Streptococcus suis]|nr:phage structural protein [Streptococcus suis]